MSTNPSIGVRSIGGAWFFCCIGTFAALLLFKGGRKSLKWRSLKVAVKSLKVAGTETRNIPLRVTKLVSSFLWRSTVPHRDSTKQKSNQSPGGRPAMPMAINRRSTLKNPKTLLTPTSLLNSALKNGCWTLAYRAVTPQKLSRCSKSGLSQPA